MPDSFPPIETEQRPVDRIGDRERLDALAGSNLLDTQTEEVFDRAVKLATRLLGTPVSLLSLVDDTRQFFKAQEGLPTPYSWTRETPLSHSFCQHVVTSGEMLAVEDARIHPLVRDNLAIADLGVIAYLGVPVVGTDGHVFGSFCVIQSEPRQWTSEEIETLRAIAKGVESEIRLRVEVARRRVLQQAADEDRQRLALVLESMADGVLSIDREMTVIYANRSARRILDAQGEPTGRRLFDVFPRGEADAFVAMVTNALLTGDEADPSETVVKIPQRERWIEARAAPSGAELTLFFRDVTVRQRALESRKLLVRELHHRMKNLFSIVRGMITMTARGASDPLVMSQALQGRLISLARAHDLIRPAISDDDDANYQDIYLADIVRILVEPYRKPGLESLSIEGPELRLGVNSTTHVALLIHELTTNANKYGALSQPGGKLSVSWALNGDALDFRWIETGGPEPTDPPAEIGFGSKLIQLCIKTQLEGEMALDWPASGMRLKARIPMGSIAR